MDQLIQTVTVTRLDRDAVTLLKLIGHSGRPKGLLATKVGVNAE